jgi:hypothetical protein
MTDGEHDGLQEPDTRGVGTPTRHPEGDRPGAVVACTACDRGRPAGENGPSTACPACGEAVEVVTFDGGDEAGDTESYAYEPSVADPPSPTEQEFGRQGWLLVGAIVVAFLVIPAAIYLNAVGVLALPFRVAFLALPMIPAVALAALAVWVTTTE